MTKKGWWSFDAVSRALRILAWLLVVAIALATFVPGELRPVSGAPVDLERLGAFLALGCAFGLAYPTTPLRALALVCVAAVGSESLQYFLPGRHAVAFDAAFKLAGVTIGYAVGWLAALLCHRRSARTQR